MFKKVLSIFLAIAIVAGTFAFLGSVFKLSAKAEEPSITTADGVTRTRGSHRTGDELPDKYIRITGDLYELESNYEIDENFEDHIIETDYSVEQGDTVILKVTAESDNTTEILRCSKLAVKIEENDDNFMVGPLTYLESETSKINNFDGSYAITADGIANKNFRITPSASSADFGKSWTVYAAFQINSDIKNGSLVSIYLPDFANSNHLAAGKNADGTSFNILSGYSGEFVAKDFGATVIIGEQRNVSFLNNDGTVNTSLENMFDGDLINKAPVLDDIETETEYKAFVGWSTVENDPSGVVAFPYEINGDIAFYPLFDTFKIINLNFVNGESVNNAEYWTAPQGSEADPVPFPNIASQPGKTFLGWAESPDATEPDIPANEIGTFTIDSNETRTEITYYAIFSIEQCVITFNTAGTAENISVTVDYGSDIDEYIPDTVLEKPGYTFNGWSAFSTATEPDATLGIANGNKTFYPVFSANNYKVNLYINRQTEEPYATLTATYGKATPTAISERPSVQDGIPVNFKFAGWYDKNNPEVLISNNERKPAGTGSYTIAGDLDVVVEWTEVSTFSFFIPGTGEAEGEWVLVGKYVSANWATIKNDMISKAAELGYSYSTGTAALERVYNPKWNTEPDGSGITVTMDGKDSSGNTVAVPSDVVTNTDYFIIGKRISNTGVYTENGDVILEASVKYEDNSLIIPMETIKSFAPVGMKFSGYFVDENGSKVDATISSLYAIVVLTYGEHTLYPVYEDIIYTTIFRVNGREIAFSENKYGETISLSDTEFTSIEPYNGFPVIPENIPDLKENPSESVNFYDYTLEAWETPGCIVSNWSVKNNGGATLALIDNDTSYTINPDDYYVSNLGKYTGKYIRNFDASLISLFYKATFTCAESGAKFPDGSAEHVLWIPAGVSSFSVENLAQEAFGTPEKEYYRFVSWSPNDGMPAEATTFSANMHGEPVKLYFIYNSNFEDENFSYESLYNNEYTGYYSLSSFCGEDGSALGLENTSSLAPYNWKPYSIPTGVKLMPAYEFETENGDIVRFVDKYGKNNEIIGNMVFVVEYESFEDQWLVMYDSDTSYLLGSVLEGLIDKERALAELFNFTGEELEPGTIESAVGDYTGRTIEQILSEELQKAFNTNIYKTVSKNFKTTYWHEGQRVNKKEAVVNPNSENDVVIWYQFKLINFNIKKIFSPEMWKHVYIAGRPVTIPKSWLDPSQTANTIQVIINVIKGIM